MRRDESTWNRVLIQCGVKPITAAMWSIHFAKVIDESTFSQGDMELDKFLGQILHESGMLEHMQESLNYSAERLMAVWPTRFPTLEFAKPYARNGAVLAEKVYGGRMGNVNPGDGARYIGRGLLQVTGRDNYRAVGKILGIDLEKSPGLLSTPELALRASIAWWEGNIPDALMGDIKRVTKRVNGGTVGLAHRIDVTSSAQKALA